MIDIQTALGEVGIVPVVRIDDAERAVELAAALQQGGIHAMEITFRTTEGEAGFAKIAECIGRVRRDCPQILLGAGTVIHPELARRAQDAGASFIVSPGYNPATVAFCQERQLPIIPGVCTPSELEVAVASGLTFLKFFPAEVCGGVAMLKALAGPFPTVRFMATGGIDEKNLEAYRACSSVVAVGGSWMVKDALVTERRWQDVSALAAQAVRLWRGN